MSRLIDADALIQELNEAKYIFGANKTIEYIQNSEIDRCISYIEDSPTVEHKHGKWEFVGENLYMCTSCGYTANANWLSDWKRYKTDSEFPSACPNCGASMVKKEGDEK